MYEQSGKATIDALTFYYYLSSHIMFKHSHLSSIENLTKYHWVTMTQDLGIDNGYMRYEL